MLRDLASSPLVRYRFRGDAMIWQIGVTVIVAALALLALHWLPWRKLLGRKLPRPAAYILGTLAMALPLTGLYTAWGLVWPVVAQWAVVAGSGVAVLGAYLFDAWLHQRQARKEAEEREKAMLREVE